MSHSRKLKTPNINIGGDTYYMTDTLINLLWQLVEGERHYWWLIDAFNVEETTLYTYVMRLKRHGLIRKVGGEKIWPDDRWFELTPRGFDVLAAYITAAKVARLMQP